MRIAVITGASSGVGLEFARLLVGEDSLDQVWAIARGQTGLDRLKAQLGEKIRPVALDLSQAEEIARLGQLLSQERPEILWLVNSAGYAKFCSCEELSVADSRNLIDLNINGVVSVGLTCLPYLIPSAHILNVASQASFQPLPYLNLYSASKAFVRNYSRALNVELKGRGVSVTAVCPGWMSTALYDRASMGAKKDVTRFVGLSKPGPVVEKALADARRGRDISVFGPYAKFTHAASKLLPQRVMMGLWLRQQKLS